MLTSMCSRTTTWNGRWPTGFALTAITGLRYTRVSADVLFDMRLALYRHLQRLSPRFGRERLIPLGRLPAAHHRLG